MDPVAIGFLLVTGSGLATTLGAAVVLSERLVQLASQRVLAASLGISAGVMLYVSFIEIMVKSKDSFQEAQHQEKDAVLYATLCFFAGILMMTLIDVVVHLLDPKAGHADPVAAKAESQAEGAAAAAAPTDAEGSGAAEHGEPLGAPPAEAGAPDAKLKRMGLLTALAIAIHNFPEGLATFVATLDDPAVGASLAIAIGIHNLPEGLCVAMPLYYSGGNRLKAFAWAFFSGLTEPLGALIGWFILNGVLDQNLYGVLFGLVGGMMVQVCVHELLPTAHRYDPGDTVVSKSVFLGMAVMALSLVLFVI